MPSTGAGRDGRPPEPRKTGMLIPTRAFDAVALAALLAAVLGAPAGGQTHYYNLDAGRPTRVEDALPTERYGLDVHLAALRLERPRRRHYGGGPSEAVFGHDADDVSRDPARSRTSWPG